MVLLSQGSFRESISSSASCTLVVMYDLGLAIVQFSGAAVVNAYPVLMFDPEGSVTRLMAGVKLADFWFNPSDLVPGSF